MVVIGVTGGVGTGKSTVARMFRERGAVVLDADAVAHDAIEPGRPAWRDIVRAFGREVVRPDRRIDRKRLAAVVFADRRRRKRLEAIIHPRVLRRMAQEVRRLRRGGRCRAVVLEVPLMVETGAQRLVDALVVVTAPRAVQRERLKRAYGWSQQEVDARIAAQWDLAAKVALADHVIDNSDGAEATRTQVEQLWNRLVPARRTPRSSTSPHSKS